MKPEQLYIERAFINVSPFSSFDHKGTAKAAQKILCRVCEGWLAEDFKKADATELFHDFYTQAEAFLYKRMPKLLCKSKHWPRTFGIFQGEFEPALSIEFPATRFYIGRWKRTLAEFGSYFNQWEVHILKYRGNTDLPCSDHSKPEEAIWSHCLLITFKNGQLMGLSDVVKLAKSKGVKGLTFAGGGNQLQIYSTNSTRTWPPPPPAAFGRFLASIDSERIERVQHWHAWLWSFGKKRKQPVRKTYRDILGHKRVKELRNLALKDGVKRIGKNTTKASAIWPPWFQLSTPSIAKPKTESPIVTTEAHEIAAELKNLKQNLAFVNATPSPVAEKSALEERPGFDQQTTQLKDLLKKVKEPGNRNAASAKPKRKKESKTHGRTSGKTLPHTKPKRSRKETKF